MKRQFTVKPKTIQASTDTRNRISDLQAYIDRLEAELADPELDLDESRKFELQMDLAEAKDNLNYAWQDDEAEYNYALERQEFNPDGSLKGYDDDSEYVESDAYTYALRIVHDGVEDIDYFVADTPQQAAEYAKNAYTGRIDSIELIGIDDDDFSADPVKM